MKTTQVPCSKAKHKKDAQKEHLIVDVLNISAKTIKLCQEQGYCRNVDVHICTAD